MKDSCGQIVKTKKILEREQDRIEKVKKAREKAIDIAMERSAKLTIKERRYESNTKRHQEQMNYEKEVRDEHFYEVSAKREDKIKYTKEHDAEIDRKGYEKYKKDHKETEERIEDQANRQL